MPVTDFKKVKTHENGTELTVIRGDVFAYSPRHDAWVVDDEETIVREFNNAWKDWAVWTKF